MNVLITTDLHLTGHQRDMYRWDLFPWLAEKIVEHNAKILFILGDLTEDKDRHAGKLVNRIVDTLVKLLKNSGLQRIYIVRGNHDGFDPDWPYFRFLNNFPQIRFVVGPFMETFEEKNVLMLPHSRNPAADWEVAPMYDADYIFMHATVQGAVSENGYTLDGVTHGIFKRAPRATIYSGDVHVPQTSGRIIYVGTPYQVRFGTQRHQCRVLLLKDFRSAVDLHFETLWRYILDVVPKDGTAAWPTGLRKGDQIKVRLHLAPHEYVDWSTYRKQVSALANQEELELCGLELVRVKPKLPLRGAPKQLAVRAPKEIFKQFCDQQKIDAYLSQVGEKLMLP